jgi:hypothetical protein
MEIELAGRRPRYDVHDAAKVLYDLVPCLGDMESRKAVTLIVGELPTLECRLSDLELRKQ